MRTCIGLFIFGVMAIGLPPCLRSDTRFADGMTNVADPSFKPQITLTPGPKVHPNKSTPVSSVADGDAHTRCVVTGVPYSITISLSQGLPLKRLSISGSDYAKETFPKDITIELDDGSKQNITLERRLPGGREPEWQHFPLNVTGRTVRLTVNSVYPGNVNWGGIGEIAVWTDGKVEAEPAPVAAKAPAWEPYVERGHTTEDATLKVKESPQAAAGQFPRTFLTAGEVKAYREKLTLTPKGKKALASLYRTADGVMKKQVIFPDPNGPQGQASSRGDKTATAHDRLALDCGTLGRAYLLGGNIRHAQKAAEILLGYAERYERYPEHKGANPHDTGKIMAQRLSEAMWLIPLLLSYDAIHDSGALSNADQIAIEQKLIRPCIEFVWRKPPKQIAAERDRLPFDWRKQINPDPKASMKSNWLIFYNSATMLAGAVLSDQDYLDVAAANFRQLIHDGIGEDGMWNEGAIGYQYFLMGGMLPGVETAARHGIDLWGFDNNRLKRLFDSPQQYAYPDGSMPGINDSGRVQSNGWQQLAFDYAYARYGDPRYTASINKAPRQLHLSPAVYLPAIYLADLPAAPPETAYASTVFDSLGLAILRDGGTYALLKYGPHGGVHGHFDKLNLILFANGDEVGGEPVFHKYEDSLHSEWTKQTVAHNTMTVDGRSQAPAEGRLTAFEASSPIKIMRATADTASPGSVLDRTVVTTPNGIFDLFTGQSTVERRWERTFRFAGKLTESPGNAAAPAPTTASARLGLTDGYQHLTLQGLTDGSQTWQGAWQPPKGKPFTVTIAGRPGQQMLTAAGPDGETVALARQTGKTASVAAFYTNADQKPGRLTTPDPDGPDVDVLRRTQDDGIAEWLFVARRPGPWTSQGYSSDASVLYVRRHADAVQAVQLAGGSVVEGPGITLKLDRPGNGYAAGTPDGLKWHQTWAKDKP